MNMIIIMCFENLKAVLHGRQCWSVVRSIDVLTDLSQSPLLANCNLGQITQFFFLSLYKTGKMITPTNANYSPIDSHLQTPPSPFLFYHSVMLKMELSGPHFSSSLISLLPVRFQQWEILVGTQKMGDEKKRPPS